MESKTINTKFDTSALPRWAQNDPQVAIGCKYSLSFRIDVHNAKTSNEKRRIKREAEKFSETLDENGNVTMESNW